MFNGKKELLEPVNTMNKKGYSTFYTTTSASRMRVAIS
jgi:hypothetical protein